jgi:hypothetical protein
MANFIRFYGSQANSILISQYVVRSLKLALNNLQVQGKPCTPAGVTPTLPKKYVIAPLES